MPNGDLMKIKAHPHVIVMHCYFTYMVQNIVFLIHFLLKVYSEDTCKNVSTWGQDLILRHIVFAYFLRKLRENIIRLILDM